MPFCSEYDLRQAAASYYAEGFRLVGQPVRWTYIERKADQIGAWWCRHHQHHNTARAAAQAQNKKDRWAFMCDKFGGGGPDNPRARARPTPTQNQARRPQGPAGPTPQAGRLDRPTDCRAHGEL